MSKKTKETKDIKDQEQICCKNFKVQSRRVKLPFGKKMEIASRCH